jgi:iron complex outermembrane receptor protein
MAGASYAQDDAGGDSEKPLEEVIVTAQKREQDLQEVTSSVVTLSDEKLDAITAGGQDIRLLSSRVPSLHIESSFGRTFPRFYIRGLGNTDFDFNASQPVSLVYDEVVLENPILKGYPIYDLERIEVLRGPQGTLFGRNTPAGIIKFESRKPSHEKDAFMRVSYGKYSSVQIEGAGGGPLAEDVLAARFSFLYQGRDDWVNNTFTGEDEALNGYDDVAGRAQLLYTPNDEFSALVNLHMRDLDGTARLFRANVVNSGDSDLASGIERDEVAIDGDNVQELFEFGAVVKVDYDLGQATVTSVTGYESADIFSRGDIDGGFGAVFAPPSGPGEIPFPSESADAVPDLEQITQEVRVASNAIDRMTVQGGVFYFREDLDIETLSYNTLGGGDVDGFASQRQEARAWAVFGAVDVQVTDRLNASGGVRYSDDDKDFVASRSLSPIGGGPLAPIVVNPSDEVVSFDVNGLFAINNEVNVYGRVARSFRAPSIQGRILFGDGVSVADTEKILSVEGGVKSYLLDNRARANVTVFYYEMDDQQLTAVGGAQNFNTLLNADKSTGVGFEADVDLLPTNQIYVTVGTSYNKTEIDDPELGTVPGAAAGLTVLDPAVPGNPGVVSIDGNSLPNAPEWVVNATARVGMPVGTQGEIFVYTDWAYRSEVNFFLYESVEFMEKSLVEGGLRVGYAPFDRSYEVAFFARNITDDFSRTGGIDFNNLTGFVNEPRTFGVEVRRSFF